MTGDEAVTVLENYAPRVADGEIAADVAQALAVLRSGLQHARVLSVVVADRSMTMPQRTLAAARFNAWDEGRRA